MRLQHGLRQREEDGYTEKLRTNLFKMPIDLVFAFVSFAAP
jgi:hypothetical protein